MKLDKTLNFKKVRCVKGYEDCLEIGKEYNVIDISVEIKVKDDEGAFLYWESDHFEPVLDSAENPLQGVKLTPEFETEASEFKFEVGNKVYKYGETDVKTVLEVFENGYMRISNYPHRVNHEVLCHATPENHALLSKPFPAIEFEQPPKELKGSDLCRAMLEKGWKYVPCYVHDGSDDEAINRKHYVSVKNETPRSGYNFSGTGANDWKYAVPIDPRTGEPLTQAVLDE